MNSKTHDGDGYVCGSRGEYRTNVSLGSSLV